MSLHEKEVRCFLLAELFFFVRLCNFALKVITIINTDPYRMVFAQFSIEKSLSKSQNTQYSNKDEVGNELNQEAL